MVLDCFTDIATGSLHKVVGIIKEEDYLKIFLSKIYNHSTLEN